MEVKLNENVNVKVNDQIYSLRLQLWGEHFNKNVKDLIDPLDEKMQYEISNDAKVTMNE